MTHQADWERPTVLSQLLGNSMATNVLSAVIIPLINVVQPGIKAVDPWTTGRMQHQLRRSALADDNIGITLSTEHAEATNAAGSYGLDGHTRTQNGDSGDAGEEGAGQSATHCNPPKRRHPRVCRAAGRSRGNPKAWHPDPVQRGENGGIVTDSSAKEMAEEKSLKMPGGEAPFTRKSTRS